MKMTSEFMNISDYNTNKNHNILDINNLGTQTGQERFAICSNCSVRRTVTEDVFVRYTFKDYKGRTIAGRHFAVKDIEKNISDLIAMKNKVVLINYDVDYFNGFYLKINEIRRLPEEKSSEIRDKFFQSEIKDLDKELNFLKNTITHLSPNENYTKIFEQFSVYDKLKMGVYEDVMEGLKGSPVKIVNMFNSNVITMFDKVKGKYIILSYILLESILSVSKNSPITAIKYLDVLAELCKSNIDPTIKNIYSMVESSLYLLFKFDKDIYYTDSIYITQIRNYLMGLLKTQNILEKQIGVFEYDGKLFGNEVNNVSSN